MPTSDYTASPGEFIRVDAHSPVTITLPSAVGNALAEVVVKEVGGGGEAITIAAPAGQHVDGLAAGQIAGPRCRMQVTSDDTRWPRV